MEYRKLIGPAIGVTAAAAVGIVIYRATTDYRNKLQKLPEFDPNYHIKLMADATPKQKELFKDKVALAYKLKMDDIISAYTKDKADAEKKEEGNILKSIVLLLPFIFGTPKPNKALRIMPVIEKTVKNKFQFSIVLNRFESYTTPTVSLFEEIINTWDNKACFRLYKFLGTLRIL